MALVAGITGGAATMWISRDTPVEVLADAANSLQYRVVEGRLSRGFDYKPLRPVVRSEGTGASEP
ncbi:MAG TPA: hypothetical protein VHL59_04345, partial [Thermoanaerobaculia bacterium]|nr:hypothetical protein [Thermoanaerobaculia bacterium]